MKKRFNTRLLKDAVDRLDDMNFNAINPQIKKGLAV
jgi:uncharacterized lipoprotein YddW (UPF0748 family)